MVAVCIAVGAVACFLIVRRKNRVLALSNDNLQGRIMQGIEAEKQTPQPEKTVETQEENGGSHQELMGAIREAMTRQGDVYKPDFCASRLEELTGINYKYLSAAINRATGGSFSALVADYRIKEACRLLSDVEISAMYT